MILIGSASEVELEVVKLLAVIDKSTQRNVDSMRFPSGNRHKASETKAKQKKTSDSIRAF